MVSGHNQFQECAGMINVKIYSDNQNSENLHPHQYHLQSRALSAFNPYTL